MNQKRTSVILAEIVKKYKNKKMSIQEFAETLMDRSFSIAILILAIPNSIPLGIPGISTITGFVIMILGLEMMIGCRYLYLPKWISEKQRSTKTLLKLVGWSIGVIEKIEFLIKPRLSLFIPLIERLAGFTIIVMGFILFLPIPFINFIAGICIVIMALGVMERDGLVIIFGIVLSYIMLTIKWNLILLMSRSLIQTLGV